MWVHLFSDGAVELATRNASLVSILDGILILLYKGYKWATVQTDNLDVAKTLTGKGLEDLGITILRQVQRIMRSKGQCQVRYVPRGKNLIAGYLAKLCLAWKSRLRISDMPPNEVLGALQQDKACGAFEQLI
ncbi:hypothetical protein Goshw_029979 [Gossypium schwendimanii]|uniref:RNase H type-1 domain-containing protein n=1 Tax=Gossypium schwendimanii TaxID=34291 RepID=A0A7J9KVK2_GOSSC|nr:hypothetical protein [Gossypium schwendimanii]